MLLVDNRQAQALEFDVLFPVQRVRPTTTATSPSATSFFNCAFSRALDDPGEQQSHIADLRENLFEVEGMLRRENFGGAARPPGSRSPTAITAASATPRRWSCRFTDIALQQPASWEARRLHVLGDFFQHAPSAPRWA